MFAKLSSPARLHRQGRDDWSAESTNLHPRYIFSNFSLESQSFALIKSKWVINFYPTPWQRRRESSTKRTSVRNSSAKSAKEILASIESNIVGLPDADKTRLRVLMSDALRGTKPHRLNLTKAECNTLKNLWKDRACLDLHADKGAAIVLDRDIYNEKVYDLLSDLVTYIKPSWICPLTLKKLVNRCGLSNTFCYRMITHWISSKKIRIVKVLQKTPLLLTRRERWLYRYPIILQYLRR